MRHATLVLSLLLGCTAGQTEEPASVEAEPAKPAEPEVAPAAEPEPEPEPEPAPAASQLRWELSAEPTKVRMAERDRVAIRIAVTNEGEETVDPQRYLGDFRLDGESHFGLNQWFGNGARLPIWSALPPGETATDERKPGEHLFEAPGTYAISFVYADATTSVTVTVTK